MTTLSHLLDKLNSANLAYAANRPYMTDIEYDELWRQIYQLDPDHPALYHTTNNPSLSNNLSVHARPVMGTNKAFCMEDLKPFLARLRQNSIVLEPKYDGCAAVLYKGNPTHRLILEGNGLAGRDISHHLPGLTLTFTPKAINSVEIIIPTSAWDPSMGKNPRNVVSGWINRATLPADQTIHLVSHDYGELYRKFNSPPKDLEDHLLECYNNWKQHYPLDGILLKAADLHQRLIMGNNGTRSHWSIAWKPPIQTAWTTLNSVEWNISRSGRVVPTLIYDPIELCGTTNSRVTGNNLMWLLERHISPGCKLLIGKAGEIIPKILQVKNTRRLPLDIPKHCPVCQTELLIGDVDLICPSDDCLQQIITRLAYFYSDKGMDLKSIGEALIGQLLESPLLLDSFADRSWMLLSPTKTELKEIEKLLGPKRTRTYIENLSDINNKKTIIHFMAGLGYKGLAYKTIIQLWHYLKGAKLTQKISQERITNFTYALQDLLRAQETMEDFQLADAPPLPAKTYCITGTLSAPRQDFIDYLAGKNWLFVNQVSRNTDLLIVGDSPGKTKLTKAKELKLPIITEGELPNYLQQTKENT